MKKGIFEGVKVAEFAWTGVGPIPGTLLATFGATVVRIESATRPDPLRTMGPYKDRTPGINRSGFYNPFNTSKYGFALNMKHPKSAGVAHRLIEWADIVTEAYTPGTMASWGLSYEEVRKFKPEIIYYSTCMAGQSGPYAELPGFGAQLTGMSGYTIITGWPDRLPAVPYGAYTDFINVRLAILSIVAALDYRRRTGKGQYIDFSQYEGGVSFLAPPVVDYTVNKRVAERVGNRDAQYVPHGVYRCQGDDRWCAIAVRTDEEWQAFCKVIGSPEWSREARFATFHDRKENEDDLDRLIEEWTVGRSAQEIMDLMQAAGVPAGMVLRPGDTFSDSQVRQRQIYRKVKHPEIGDHHAIDVSAGYRFSKVAPEIKTASPCLGEHTEHVCTHLLGMPDEEFTRLFSEGVFE